MHALLSKISYDREQTHEKMKLLPFALFPNEFITLLDTIGIGAKKPSEIMQLLS